MFSFSRKEELIEASLKGNLSKIKEILADPKYSVDTCDEKNCSLLLNAVFNKHIEVVEYLLEKKANPNLASEEGVTPLIFAARFRDEVTVSLLLNAGANINTYSIKTKQYDFINPIIAALSAPTESKPDVDHPHQIIFLLLSRGADPNLPNDVQNISSPLHLAVEKERTATVEILIKHNACVTATDRNNQTALHYAAKKGFVAITQILINHIVNQQQHVLFDMLDGNHMSPIMLAASGGHDGVIQLLIQIQANVNNMFLSDKHVYSALLFAIQRKHGSTVLLLLENGADPNKHLCLHLAIESNQIPVIKTLLTHDAPPTTVDKHKKTPLHLAASLGNLEMIQMLFEAYPKSSYLQMQDNKGNTALHLAMINKQIKAALFIDEAWYKSIYIEQRESRLDDYEPIKRQLALNQQLLTATDQSKPEEIEKLLQEGAHIEAVNNDPPHNTALLKTIIKNDLICAKLLLQHGANSKAENANKEKAISLVECMQMFHLVLSFGEPTFSPNDLKKVLKRIIQNEDHAFAQDILRMPLFSFFRIPAMSLTISFIADSQYDPFAFLLKNKFIAPDMPIQIDKSQTPLLLYVAQYGNHQMMEALLNTQPDLNILDENGKTILHCMAQNLTCDLFPILTKNNIYFPTYDPLDKLKMTPLMIAVNVDNISAIRFLLSMHANIHAFDLTGKSALDISKNATITQMLCYHCMLYQPNISEEEIISIEEMEYFLKNANVTKKMFCAYVESVAEEAYQKGGIQAKVAVFDNALKKPTVLSDYMNTSQQFFNFDLVHLKVSLRKLRNGEEYEKTCSMTPTAPPFVALPPPYSTVEKETATTSKSTYTNRVEIFFYQNFDDSNNEAKTWRKQWPTRL